MGSPLDYISTEGFRQKLISRNLVPYAKSPTKVTPPTTYEIVQNDLVPVDSPDFLIDTPYYANQLYPLNKWGNDGGYEQLPDLPVNVIAPNQGEYGPGQQDAKRLQDAQIAAKIGFPGVAPPWQPLNAFGNNSLQLTDAGEFVTSLETINNSITGGVPNLFNNQPYPTTFNSSSYSPLSILLSPDPQGSNGRLSSDSFIARLGNRTLRREFQERIGRAIIRETIGRANFLNINSSTNVVNILTGRVPLIEPNYQITVPANPITAAVDFSLRLAGSEVPFSLIPGSYFDPNINPPRPSTIAQSLLANPIAAAGNFVSNLLGAGKTGSQIFYNNTGGGQKSILWKNINFNRYKPNYDRTLLDRLGGTIVGSQTNNANFYVGSTTSDPSRVFSPSRELPVDAFGNEQQSPVYGPQELAQLYEGPSKEIRLGANGPTYSNGGGIEGGFTWTSTKYRGNAGKTVGLGGVIVNQDEDFKPSSYNSTESTERTFKQGSILDDTQRIINSQPQGGKRLQHVGNAIDQVSKVFHDGYKEITKGSKVLSYVGAIGQEVGTEYCRVFTKDVPYLQYNDLQKTDGIVTEGRRFSYSVLDKTYNLNIVPNKQEGGQDSTNIIGNADKAYAKKYMFSIENLAWRTSSTPGYTVSDLPVCERGPNGGRVMWFPPYGLKFNESITPSFQPHEFLGRPEPIYTYKNTTRTGTLEWKIVVDHPSVLNVIVNKVLSNETNKTRVDSILESFFAGCKKYDLYELAKKYYTIPPSDLFQIQKALDSKELSPDQTQFFVKYLDNSDQVTGDNSIGGAPVDTFKQFLNTAFYFNNAIPKPSESQNFQVLYDGYVNQQTFYQTQSPTTSAQTTSFFKTVVESNKKNIDDLIIELEKQFKNNSQGSVTIVIDATTSAKASISSNDELSVRRINSAVNYIENRLSTYVNGSPKRLTVRAGTARGEQAQPESYNQQTKTFFSEGRVNCTDNDGKGDNGKINNEVYTTNAMACRRAYISSITSTLNEPPTAVPPKKTTVTTDNVVTKAQTQPVNEIPLTPKDNISKKVLRSLLTECDYFETIKEESPLVFDNLRDKLKFFQPGFHSMTPEGLNSRLTFLQQCTRPGDTIPTVRVDSGEKTLSYNDATNTSFGAPPVLVLRVGDFFNTKIIPTSLQISYEDLDLNPEGIGVQPMIANVTMSFNFVGGSGLKESVDKLQNALTFNYYANTEVYDDRADSTDFSYKVIDLDFIKDAANKTAPPTINQSVPNNGQSNNKTIGDIITTVIVESGQTGTTSYSIFMDKSVEETQNYFTNVVNKNKEVTSQYNNAVRQQWMAERIYQNGKSFVDKQLQNLILFGKPNNLEKRVDKIFKELIDDIKGNDELFIKFISESKYDFTKPLIRQVKENYVNFVTNKKGSFLNAATNITNSMVNVQQNYMGYWGRLNTITYADSSNLNLGTDGYQTADGKVFTYITTGTTEIDPSSKNVTNTFKELQEDVKKLNSSVTDFNKIIWDKYPFKGYNDGVLVFGPESDFNPKNIFNPFNTDDFKDLTFRRVYMILSNDVVDSKKYESFKNALIGNILSNGDLMAKNTTKDGKGISGVFDEYWETAKEKFVKENNTTKEFIDDVEKNKLTEFLKYNPFNLKKKRILEYGTEENGSAGRTNREKLIKGLGWTENQNTNNKTWNDENPVDVFISKAKLN